MSRPFYGAAVSTTINDGREDVIGTSTGTTINGGVETVGTLATTIGTTINNGGLERVEGSTSGLGGATIGTTINDGGREVLDEHATSTGTTINNGGVEDVLEYGGAINTTINNGGLEIIDVGGSAANVTFGGPQAIFELRKPSGLIGVISNWHVGDVIDFLNTAVTRVQENPAHTTLTVTYGTNETASYGLAGKQADTEFKLQSDGHGGTELILIGIASPHPAM
jgi:autotransporter passenger strand-loop-strand repeat protein